jgi:hypothetical protein
MLLSTCVSLLSHFTPDSDYVLHYLLLHPLAHNRTQTQRLANHGHHLLLFLPLPVIWWHPNQAHRCHTHTMGDASCDWFRSFGGTSTNRNTPIRVWAGTKISHPVGFISRNSTERAITLTQPPPKHHHHGGAVCPYYGVVFVDHPNPTRVTSSKGVG